MVKTASLYDNFCKTGNDVSDDETGVGREKSELDRLAGIRLLET